MKRLEHGANIEVLLEDWRGSADPRLGLPDSRFRGERSLLLAHYSSLTDGRYPPAAAGIIREEIYEDVLH
jgi:hypothetical protein